MSHTGCSCVAVGLTYIDAYHKVADSIFAQSDMYSIQYYVIKFCQVGVFAL